MTIIEFNTAPAKSSEALLEAAKEHPLFKSSTFSISANGFPTYTISFGKGCLEFARFTFSRDATGLIVLTTVKGNLPVLLWGHEGCMIQDQYLLELGLTRLRWFGSGLVEGGDTGFLLPHVSTANTGRITELGLAVQLIDIDGGVFNAGSFSTVNGSAEPPVLEPGHTTLPGKSVSWHIRRVKNGLSSFDQAPLTRLECCIRDPDLLAKGVRIKYPEWYFLAALPFDNHLALFKRATKDTLGGGLAVPKSYNTDSFAAAMSRVTRQSHHPESFNLALQMEQLGMRAERADKFRRLAFGECSRSHKPCLSQILADGALDKYCQAPNEEIEAAHEVMLMGLGCPVFPHEPTSETFRGPLLRARADPHQRLFFNLEDGLPY